MFIGPDPAVMRLVGDKIAAKRLAEASGVPVAPWSRGPVATYDDAVAHANRIGFPLMIKAAAGGGGRGIRRVDDLGSLGAAFDSARAEALQSFGSDVVLLEKLVTAARHIEVQIIADGYGNAWAVGVRDCSYQRRNQKVLEESASTALTAEQEVEIKEAARRLVLRAGYRNAGTVEFLYEPAEQRFSFMEVNARLQVEHPVTEAVTGLDLVKLQLHVATGGRLDRRATDCVRARDRGAAERRGPGARVRARAGAAVRAAVADRARLAGRHGCRRGRCHPARVRLDDRQGDRLGV